VVDVGTISVRLLVADVCGERVDTIVRRAEITRMGEGLRPGQRLLPAAAERTGRAVRDFVEQARSLEPARIILAGTSATREAADGRDFLESVADGLGVTAVVLSGREEAEFAYAGATLDVAGDPLVLDIGGGSTELSRRRGIRFATVSLDMGASKATERWIQSDPPTTAEIDAVLREARAVFGPHVARFAGQPGPLVGVAGTVTTIACLAAGLDRYDRDALHLRLMTADEVRAQLERLAAMTLEQRAALACVQAGRAPVIVAGAAVLLAAMEALGFTELTVSERDLLDGLALHGPW
jgi:exopolyphosphatase/guanosine-5'-triphosphate,3'-diphosphate pyrophosphatase